MKIHYIKLKNWLLMTVMGILGLTGCNSHKAVTEEPAAKGDAPVVQPKPRGGAVVMYGVPTMDFVLKGRVIDQQGQPVQGMQVILVNGTVDISPEYMQEDNPYVQEYISKASDTTDVEGAFECHMKDVPNENQRVIVRDVDGDKNGIHEDQMLEVVFSKETQTQEGSGWYVGTRTKDVDITVNKK